MDPVEIDDFERRLQQDFPQLDLHVLYSFLRENLEIFSFEDESQLNSKINTRSTFYKSATN